MSPSVEELSAGQIPHNGIDPQKNLLRTTAKLNPLHLKQGELTFQAQQAPVAGNHNDTMARFSQTGQDSFRTGRMPPPFLLKSRIRSWPSDIYLLRTGYPMIGHMLHAFSPSP